MKYSLRCFLNNIRYLAKYNLKELNNRTEVLTVMPDFIDRIKYEIKDDFEHIILPKIMNNFETLKCLIESDKSFIRFGDGEYNIMEGKSIAFQKYNENLAKSLQEIIMTEDEKLLIGIGRGNFYSLRDQYEFCKNFSLTWVPLNYKIIKKYLKEDKTYGSTGVFAPHVAFEKNYDFEKNYKMIEDLFDKKNIVVICGDKIFDNIQYNVFNKSSSVEYIYGPTKHAYTQFNSLKEKIFQISKNKILVFALGPAGKSLAYEAFKKGFRVLDAGHAIKSYDDYKKKNIINTNNIINFFAPDE